MTRQPMAPATAGALACLLAACSPAPEHLAEVKLTIDGVAFDYSTSKAQVDQQERGGPYSVYLVPNDAAGKAPYLCLRTYSGNPVAELWVRYTKPDRAQREPDADLGKYDCFVPGALADGRPTLGWTDDDGKARDRTVTGEPDCTAAVRREGNTLLLTFDARLQRKALGKSKASSDGSTPDDASTGDRITAKGSAAVQLRR